MITKSGSFRLFRWSGIDVFLHWSWLVVALIEINIRRNNYSSLIWNAAEYIALFVIVLLHEFGHALACRQVGGQANKIILWPLGGVAFVAPPQRPGATLWSIAAGPLVNLVLIPIALVLAVMSQRLGWGVALPDGQQFLWAMVYINVALLVFNLLPIYPLDGGQILRALLWFLVGRSRSLKLATAIGFIGAAALMVYAIAATSVWMGLMAFFMLASCWSGWKQAVLLSRMDQMPRRPEFACPACHASPPIGTFWRCRCQTVFDIFATGAVCPKCQAHFETTQCVHCGVSRPMAEWLKLSPIAKEQPQSSTVGAASL